MQLGNDCSHNIKNLGVSGVRYISVVVDKYSFQERRHDVGVDRIMVICLLDICIQKLQYFFLDGPKTSHFGCFCCVLS